MPTYKLCNYIMYLNPLRSISEGTREQWMNSRGSRGECSWIQIDTNPVRDYCVGGAANKCTCVWETRRWCSPGPPQNAYLHAHSIQMVMNESDARCACTCLHTESTSANKQSAHSLTPHAHTHTHVFMCRDSRRETGRRAHTCMHTGQVHMRDDKRCVLMRLCRSIVQNLH